MRKRSVAILLSITLVVVGNVLLARPSQDNASGSETDDTQNKPQSQSQNTLADAGFILSKASDGGICGRLVPGYDPGFTVGAEDRVLKINDIYTKGRSLSQLQSMLSGPAGTSVKITLLVSGGRELTVHEIKIDTLENKRIFPYSNIILAGVDIFERPNMFSNNFRMAQAVEPRGTFLFVGSALKNLLKHQPHAIAPTSDAEVLISIPYSLEFFDKAALFEEGGEAIQFATEMSKRNLKSLYHREILACVTVAQYLESTKRLQQANSIWRNLYSTLSEAKAADQITILSGYAKFLSHYPSHGSAKIISDQLNTLCMNNLGKASLDGLATVGKIDAIGKDYAKAAKVLRVLADQRKKYFDPQKSNYVKYQDTIITLANLSDVYLASSEFEAASDSLKEALAIYDENLNTDEIVQLERGFSPCYSEIQTRLANVCKQAGDKKEADKWFERARLKVEESFGKDSAQVKALVLENVDYDARQESYYRPNLDWLEAHHAYDLLRESKNKKARLIIEKLVLSCKQKDSIDLYAFFRVFNLARELSKSNKTEALEILSQLEKIAEKFPATAMKATVLAEMVSLLERNANSAKADEKFKELEQELLRIEALNHPEMNHASRRSDFDLAQFNINRVKTMALYFRFIDEPQTALILFEKLEKGLSSRDIRRQLIVEEILLCNLQLKKFEQANLDSVLTENINYDKIHRLIQAATICINQDKVAQARKLMDALARYGEQNKIGIDQDNLYTSLADMETRLKNYTAAQNFRAKANKKLHAQQTSEFQALAFASQGETKEAIKAYLEASLSEIRRGRSEGNIASMEMLNKALALMLNQKDIESSAISKLNEIVQRVPVDDESKQMSEQIIQIAKLKSSQPLLLHEGEFEMAAKLGENANLNADGTNHELSRARIDAELKKNHFEKAAELIISLLEQDYKHTNSRFNPHPGNRRVDLFVQEFESAGRLDLLETILKRAFELDQQQPDHAKSIRLLNAIFLVDVYAKQKKSQEALALSKNILAIYAKNAEQAFPPGSNNVNVNLEVLLGAVDSFIKYGQLDDAKQLTDNISSLYQNIVGPKHPAFVALLERDAAICKARQDKEGQKKYLAKAFEIASFNWGRQGRMTATVRMKYASALREMQEQSEADKFETIQPPPFKRMDEKSLYGSRYISVSHSPPPDAYADSAEPVLLEHLKNSIAAGGINGDVLNQGSVQIRDMLIDFYLARQKYSEAEKLELEMLQLWTDVEGRFGNRRLACMNDLATINLAKGDRNKAEQWVSKAEKANVFNYSLNALKSAAIRLELGDKAQAVKLLRSVSQNYTQDYSPFTPGFKECAYLLAQAGQTDEVARLTKLYETQKAKRKGNFYGGYGWNQKRTEPVYELQDGVWVRMTRAIKMIEDNSRMRQYRRSLEMKNQRSNNMESMRSRVPENVFEAIKRNHEQMLANRAKQVAEAEQADKMRLGKEELRRDFATSRIVAMQEATRELNQTQMEIENKRIEDKRENDSRVTLMSQKLEAAAQNKVSNPAAYIMALRQLAYSYQASKNVAKAQEIRLKALNEFLLYDNRNLSASAYHTVVDCFVTAVTEGKMTLTQALPYFSKLIEKAERANHQYRDDVNDSIYELISETSQASNDRSWSIKFYEIWIAERKKILGAHDITLYPLLSNLAVNCLLTEDFKKAKQTYLECRNVVAKDPQKRLQNELNLAVCLAQSGEVKEGEKCWKEAGKAHNWIFDQSSYRSFKYLAIKLKNIGQEAQAKEVEKIMRAAERFKD